MSWNRTIYNQKLLIASILLNGVLLLLSTQQRTSSNELCDTYWPPMTDEHVVDSVFFMKTHKTGGSGIQNIMMRHALESNLNIGLSSTYGDWSRICISKNFSRDCLCNDEKEIPVNIITHHMVFDRHEVESVINKDAKYISIVRDPLKIITSGFTYFGWNKKFNEFSHFVNGTTNSTEVLEGLDIPYRNLMMYVFGLSPSHFDNDLKIQEKLEEIKSRFDLIMINSLEHFNQSLILLKELLHWNLDDVVVLAVNQQLKRTKQVELSETIKTQVYQANKADQLLYNTFLQIFEMKVKEYGEERMAREVKRLVLRTEQLKKLCIAKTVPDKSTNTLEYVLTSYGQRSRGCRYLAANEITLTADLIRRHNHGLPKNRWCPGPDES